MKSSVKFKGYFFSKAHSERGTAVGPSWLGANTEAGTVQGQLQGPTDKVKQMQEWLKTTGSPRSRIDKAEFKNEKKIETLDHEDFKVVK
ncbi:hypothetical protein AALO_G00248120 [Alosa alosa]|uniref:acylphosphatase n=1 Tax=Alosa alosa TaxID=278164 RepID=A0AAV6FZZ4_9TELE|nr:hypothetical protein AALO_G00248120 [Alosa alosa]